MICAVSTFLHSSLRSGTVTYFARRPRAPPPRTYKSLRATFRRPRQVLTTDTVDIAADAAAAAAQAEAAAAAVQAEEEGGEGRGKGKSTTRLRVHSRPARVTLIFLEGQAEIVVKKGGPWRLHTKSHVQEEGRDL